MECKEPPHDAKPSQKLFSRLQRLSHSLSRAHFSCVLHLPEQTRGPNGTKKKTLKRNS